MMPLEKTSRWPRSVSWRGRNESSATKLARKGKPLKLVLAASVQDEHRRDLDSDVEEHVAGRRCPKTYLAIWETTVGVPPCRAPRGSTGPGA